MPEGDIVENVFATVKELSPESQRFLLKILAKQADIEFGIYNLHLVWQSRAETSEDRWKAARTVTAEISHGLQVIRFLRDFGEEGEKIGEEIFKRKTGEHEFEILNKKLQDWIDVCAFACFVPLVDIYQLQMLKESSYKPLQRAMPLIINEEGLHPSFGINGLLKALNENKATHEEVKQRIYNWIKSAPSIFGYGLPKEELIPPQELNIPGWDWDDFYAYYKENVDLICEKLGIEPPEISPPS